MNLIFISPVEDRLCSGSERKRLHLNVPGPLGCLVRFLRTGSCTIYHCLQFHCPNVLLLYAMCILPSLPTTEIITEFPNGNCNLRRSLVPADHRDCVALLFHPESGGYTKFERNGCDSSFICELLLLIRCRRVDITSYIVPICHRYRQCP